MITVTNKLNSTVTKYDTHQKQIIAETIEKIDIWLNRQFISSGNQLHADLKSAFENPYLTLNTKVSLVDPKSNTEDWCREFTLTFTVLNYCTIVLGTPDIEFVPYMQKANKDLFGN